MSRNKGRRCETLCANNVAICFSSLRFWLVDKFPGVPPHMALSLMSPSSVLLLPALRKISIRRCEVVCVCVSPDLSCLESHGSSQGDRSVLSGKSSVPQQQLETSHVPVDKRVHEIVLVCVEC